MNDEQLTKFMPLSLAECLLVNSLSPRERLKFYFLGCVMFKNTRAKYLA